MDKLYSSPMPVVRSLDIEKDSLKPRDNVQGMLGLEVHNISMPLDPPTNWLGIQNIFQYLQGTPHYLTYSGNFREI
jgi:hypothetical protein